MTFPATAAYAVRKVRHFVENGVHCGDDIFTVNQDYLVLRGTQSYLGAPKSMAKTVVQ